MTLTAFLLERCDEKLAEEHCTYEVVNETTVRCLCVEPTEEATALLERVNLILWLCRLDNVGEVFLRLLADEHAEHPNYRLEWHRLGVR